MAERFDDFGKLDPIFVKEVSVYIYRGGHLVQLNMRLCLQVAFLGMTFGAPVLGWVADRYGRRTVSNLVGSLIVMTEEP